MDGALQGMTAACVSGRPTPTAQFWKPGPVTTWLVLCSLMPRGTGLGTGRVSPGSSACHGGTLGLLVGTGPPCQVVLEHFEYD